MKIIAVGRNYAEHAKELNNIIPTEPVIFLKPDTALLKNNQAFYHPDFSENIHYEVEVIVIAPVFISEQQAFSIFAFQSIQLAVQFIYFNLR